MIIITHAFSAARDHVERLIKWMANKGEREISERGCESRWPTRWPTPSRDRRESLLVSKGQRKVLESSCSRSHTRNLDICALSDGGSEETRNATSRAASHERGNGKLFSSEGAIELQSMREFVVDVARICREEGFSGADPRFPRPTSESHLECLPLHSFRAGTYLRSNSANTSSLVGSFFCIAYLFSFAKRARFVTTRGGELHTRRNR